MEKKVFLALVSFISFFAFPICGYANTDISAVDITDSVRIMKIIDNIRGLKDSKTLDPIDFSKVNQLIGRAEYFKKMNISKSFTFAKEALCLSVSKSYKRGVMNSLVLYGVLLKNNGRHVFAAKCSFAALKIAEELKDQERISACLNNIGAIFQEQNNYKDAKNYFLRSLEIEKKRNNKPQQSIRLYNLGTVYEKMDSNNQAKGYYYNSLVIEEAAKNKDGIFYALYGLAGVNTRENDIVNAEKNLSRAILLASELGYKSRLAACYLEKARLLVRQNKLAEAITSFHWVIRYAKDVGYKNEERDAYSQLSQVYAALNRFDSAFVYLNKYNYLHGIINGVDAQIKIASIQRKYEVYKKDLVIDSVLKEKQLSDFEASHQRSTRNYLIVVVCLAFFLLAYNIRTFI